MRREWGNCKGTRQKTPLAQVYAGGAILARRSQRPTVVPEFPRPSTEGGGKRPKRQSGLPAVCLEDPTQGCDEGASLQAALIRPRAVALVGSHGPAQRPEIRATAGPGSARRERQRRACRQCKNETPHHDLFSRRNWQDSQVPSGEFVRSHDAIIARSDVTKSRDGASFVLIFEC
jgi:hypothetical protein